MFSVSINSQTLFIKEKMRQKRKEKDRKVNKTNDDSVSEQQENQLKGLLMDNGEQNTNKIM